MPPTNLGIMLSKKSHKETTTANKSKINSMFSRGEKSAMCGHGSTNVAEWELRPGGMLVQKRDSNGDQNSASAASTIKVKVKYGSSYHEIRISSHASFGTYMQLHKFLCVCAWCVCFNNLF